MTSSSSFSKEKSYIESHFGTDFLSEEPFFMATRSKLFKVVDKIDNEVKIVKRFKYKTAKNKYTPTSGRKEAAFLKRLEKEEHILHLFHHESDPYNDFLILECMETDLCEALLRDYDHQSLLLEEELEQKQQKQQKQDDQNDDQPSKKKQKTAAKDKKVASTRLLNPRNLIHQLLLAVLSCKKHCIYHGDIKPENLLVGGLLGGLAPLKPPTEEVEGKESIEEIKGKEEKRKEEKRKEEKGKKEGKEIKSPDEKNGGSKGLVKLALKLKLGDFDRAIDYKDYDKKQDDDNHCDGKNHSDGKTRKPRPMPTPGTHYTSAPEVILDIPGSCPYAADMWSVGCVFASIFFIFPFDPCLKSLDENNWVNPDVEFKDIIHALSNTDNLIPLPTLEDWSEVKTSPMFSRIKDCFETRGNDDDREKEKVPKFPVSSEAEFDENARDLLVKMLAINPRNRISVEDALAHPYFSPSENK
jgi:serine/threonine protein kinase